MIGIGISIPKVASKPMLLPRRIAAILRKPNLEAHLYMPGVGRIDGFAAGNYLESTGNTNASVDGAVGLVLDAAGSVVPELVTNGDFANGTTGWTLYQPTSGSVSVSSGSLRIYSADGSICSAVQPTLPSIVADKYYRFTADQNVVSGSLTITIGATAFTAPTTSKLSFVVKATASNPHFEIKRNGVTDITLDNISVREVTGTHATQATTANKPTLRQTNGKYAWQFDGVDDRLVLGSVPFQMADDHWVVVAGNTAASGASILFSEFDSAGSSFIQCYASGNSLIAEWRDSAASTSTIAIPNAIGSEFVFTQQKQANALRARLNSGAFITNNSTLGAFTLNTASIGSNRFGNYHNGKIHAVFFGKGAISDADLKTLEKWIGSLAGVSIP